MGGRQLEKALLQHVLAPGQEELAVSVLGTVLTTVKETLTSWVCAA
jgi:hypothetical protein